MISYAQTAVVKLFWRPSGGQFYSDYRKGHRQLYMLFFKKLWRQWRTIFGFSVYSAGHCLRYLQILCKICKIVRLKSVAHLQIWKLHRWNLVCFGTTFKNAFRKVVVLSSKGGLNSCLLLHDEPYGSHILHTTWKNTSKCLSRDIYWLRSYSDFRSNPSKSFNCINYGTSPCFYTLILTK